MLLRHITAGTADLPVQAPTKYELVINLKMSHRVAEETHAFEAEERRGLLNMRTAPSRCFAAWMALGCWGSAWNSPLIHYRCRVADCKHFRIARHRRCCHSLPHGVGVRRNLTAANALRALGQVFSDA